MIQYSVTGIPYIQLNSDNRLIFSGNENGAYRWLAFSGYSDHLSKVKNKNKNKYNEVVVSKQKISFMMKMNLTKIPPEYKKVVFFDIKSQKNWSNIISKYLNENGELPRDNIKKFDEEINNINMVIK